MKNPVTILLVVAVIFMLGYIVNLKVSNKDSDTDKTPVTTNNNGPKINLSNQGLTKAPEYIFSQSNLEELDLSYNSIGGALQSQIRNLKKLKVLNLSNNKFTGVPAEVGQLVNLEVLNLSKNQITGLPYELGNLKNLKLLDLSQNQYSEIDLAKIKETLPKTTIIKTK